MSAVTLLDKWRLIQAVAADPDLSPGATKVMLRLLAHHNSQTGQCSPSYLTLAEGAALTRRHVIRAVRELEGQGWLLVDRVRGGDPEAAKGFVTNGFRIAFRRDAAPTPGVTETPLPPGDKMAPPPSDTDDTPPSVVSVTPGVTETPLPGVTETTLKSEKQSGKGNREESPPTPSRFDEWWETYPRRDGKIAARKAYDRTIKQGLGSHDELVAGARRYADARAGQDPKFTKMPTTWLNGGHWADEPPPQPAPLRGGRSFSATRDWLMAKVDEDE